MSIIEIAPILIIVGMIFVIIAQRILIFLVAISFLYMPIIAEMILKVYESNSFKPLLDLDSWNFCTYYDKMITVFPSLGVVALLYSLIIFTLLFSQKFNIYKSAILSFSVVYISGKTLPNFREFILTPIKHPIKEVLLHPLHFYLIVIGIIITAMLFTRGK